MATQHPELKIVVVSVVVREFVLEEKLKVRMTLCPMVINVITLTQENDSMVTMNLTLR